MDVYRRRVVDDELDELLAGLSAVSIEGPKAVGKTETAMQRAQSVFRLDDEPTLQIASAAPQRLIEGPTPILIDEWQRFPASWDIIRHAVDEAPSVSHLRTRAGEQEIDLIVERCDGRVVALEVKLSATVSDHDTRHLHWLKDRIGDDLLDAAVVTTGSEAYRRPDGIGVIPAALLAA